MLWAHKRSDCVKIALFYEFAKTVLEDLRSLENEIRRLKTELAKLESKR